MLQQLPVFSRSLLRETLSELALLLPEDLTNYDISLYGPACLLSVGASHKLTSIVDAVAVERQDLPLARCHTSAQTRARSALEGWLPTSPTLEIEPLPRR